MPSFSKPSDALKMVFIDELQKCQQKAKNSAVDADHALMAAVGRVLDSMQTRFDNELRRLRIEIATDSELKNIL